jgi:hypothetical protein
MMLFLRRIGLSGGPFGRAMEPAEGSCKLTQKAYILKSGAKFTGEMAGSSLLKEHKF